MRYFEVINVNDKNAQTFIDGIRLFAVSRVKHKAHVTLKGPLNSAIKPERIKKENQIVTIDKAGNFFKENQNTVFLKCSLQSRLKNMMYKPDYGNENPHITIYDGNDREYAEQIYNLLNKYPVRFQVIVNELGLISSKSEYTTFENDFFDHLSYYIGQEIDKNTIEQLTQDQRLEYIEKLLSLFKGWQNENVIANPVIGILKKLNYSEQNGLFFYDDIRKWDDFPTRIKQAIHQIRPYAFLSLKELEKDKNIDYNLPFIFIFSNPSDEEEKKIKRGIFNFGNAPIVIIHQRARIKILNGLIFSGTYDRPELENLLKNSDNITEFSYENLLTTSFWDTRLENKQNRNIYASFLSNISQIRNYLITHQGLSGTICNRLIGRLLFIRYFIDRGVCFPRDNETSFFSSEIIDARKEFAKLIKDKKKLYAFFNYFGKKFNGDLFPIDREGKEINLVNENHLMLLSELFMGGDFSTYADKIYLQRSLFDVYDFSIIPIELVSNVYERFMGDKQDKEYSVKIKNKAFYTPYFLVDFVLENSIEFFLKNTSLREDFICPVLDPSCGSGIFLVESLRRIIEKKIRIKERALTYDELWQCVSGNIFGIDIDPDAIDIAIFSIYITILDYVEPKEITDDFKFMNMKGENFFICDFFNTEHGFNDIIPGKNLKFIIGNPPWGQINNSPYLTYCHKREKYETQNRESKTIIGISDNQIAQAFLVRVSDFFGEETKCAFVITSKVLYNSNAWQWRKYFFNEFFISQIYDFSPVRSSLFEDASWPAMIVFYSKIDTGVFEFFSINSGEYSKHFNSFSVNQQNIKKFTRNEILLFNNNYDWFWKTMLYGSFFDFLIIKKLKNSYPAIFDIIYKYDFYYGVGLKRKDGKKKPASSNLIGYKFIDTQKKELQPFVYNSSAVWNEKIAGNIPQLKDADNFPVLFKPPMALVKEGLTPDIKGVSAFCNEKMIFTHSIRAIKGTKQNIDVLKSIVGLINSNIFSYYILHTGSSVGVDLTRANQIEQFSFPVVLSKDISFFVDNIIKLSRLKAPNSQERENAIKLFNQKIIELYGFRKIEIDFINYTLEHTIHTIKNVKNPRIKIEREEDINGYKNIFRAYFVFYKFIYRISYHIDKRFIVVFFQKIKDNSPITNHIDKEKITGILKFYFRISEEKISKKIFMQKNITEISHDGTAYCIIKSNNLENWQSANAWLDLVEFIKEMIYPDKDLHEIYEDVFNLDICA